VKLGLVEAYDAESQDLQPNWNKHSDGYCCNAVAFK